jgi:hypothetical protein
MILVSSVDAAKDVIGMAKERMGNAAKIAK